MQVQTISNSTNQNFTGKVEILGDLSYNPCRYVRQAYDSMQELIKDKPFDLFIKQNHKENTLSMIAKKSEHLGKPDKPFIRNSISDVSRMDDGSYTKDLYISTAEYTIDLYDSAYPTYTNGEKVKRFFAMLRKNFIKATQD